MFFVSTDVEQAQGLAVDYAARFGVPLVVDDSGALESLTATASGTVPVVRADTLATRDRRIVAGLVRSSQAVAYGRTAPPEFADISCRVAGLPDAVDAYRSLRGEGISDETAAQVVAFFHGDASAAEDHLRLLNARGRVLRCVDAIKTQDLDRLSTECEKATSIDVNVVLRSIVVEYETLRSLAWTEEEIGPLLDNIEYVSRMLPRKFVKSPSTVFFAIMVGVYYAYAEQRQQ